MPTLDELFTGLQGVGHGVSAGLTQYPAAWLAGNVANLDTPRGPTPDVRSMPQARRGAAPRSGYFTGGDAQRVVPKPPQVSFQEALAGLRADNAAMAERNPMAWHGGRAGGAGILGALTGGTGFASNVGRQAVAGGVEGFTENEDLTDAGIGALVGGGLGTVGHGGKAVIDKLADMRVNSHLKGVAERFKTEPKYMYKEPVPQGGVVTRRDNPASPEQIKQWLIESTDLEPGGAAGMMSRRAWAKLKKDVGETKLEEIIQSLAIGGGGAILGSNLDPVWGTVGGASMALGGLKSKALAEAVKSGTLYGSLYSLAKRKPLETIISTTASAARPNITQETNRVIKGDPERILEFQDPEEILEFKPREEAAPVEEDDPERILEFKPR